MADGDNVWPFPPNWRQPVHAVYQFKTDIFTSRSGKEQRRALRTSPRVSVKFTVTRAAEDRRKLDRLLRTAQVAPMSMADLTRKVRLTAPADVGATVLQVSDASVDWLDVTRYVIVAGPTGYLRYLVDDRDVDAGTITLHTATSVALGAETKIHPSYTGRLSDSIDAKLITTTVVESDIQFEPFPGANAAIDPGSPEDVFNQREVFLFSANWANPVELNYVKSIDQVDFGRGRTAYYQPVSFGERTRKFQMVMPCEAARNTVVGMFSRMKGQRGEFYMPQWEDDFTVAVPAAAGDTTLVVEGTEVHETYQADDLYRAVVIRAGNYRFYRKITATTSDGINTTITTDLPWPVPVDQTTRMNWLVVHRFASDQLDLECVTDEVTRTEISVRALEDLPVSPPDQVLLGLDGAAQWVLDNWGIGFFSGEIYDPLNVIVNWEYPWASVSIGESALFNEQITNLVFRYEGILS